MEHQARRQWTREWWEVAKGRDTLVTSAAVVAELRMAPEPKRSDGLALLDPLRLLALSSEVDDLTLAYIAHKLMPRDAARPPAALSIPLRRLGGRCATSGRGDLSPM